MPTTYLEAKLSTEVDADKLEQLFSDYRDVDGVKVAHHPKTSPTEWCRAR